LYNEKEAKTEIEEYIVAYDKQIEERIAREKMLAEDDDGWTTVTSGKKRGKFAPTRKESIINKVQQKEEQRKKKKQLLNFYTFQIREAKKQSKYTESYLWGIEIQSIYIILFFLLDLAELRKKFELDKKRLQELKKKRTFKPF